MQVLVPSIATGCWRDLNVYAGKKRKLQSVLHHQSFLKHQVLLLTLDAIQKLS